MRPYLEVTAQKYYTSNSDKLEEVHHCRLQAAKAGCRFECLDFGLPQMYGYAVCFS